MGKESAAAHGSPTGAECLEMGFACACHNLRRAARAVTHVFDAFFDEVGLKTTQFTVLAVLAYDETKKQTVSELAESLVLDQSSLSRNLAVLERLGFVRLVPGHDRRERIVTLTKAGRAALARGYPVWKRAQAAIASTMRPDELDAQLRSLRHMTASALALRAPQGTERARRPRTRKTRAADASRRS